MSAANPIKTTKELMLAMGKEPDICLFWQTGSKPSASGSYTFGGSRVYASAVIGAERKQWLKLIINTFSHRKYRLSLLGRNEATKVAP